MDLLDEIIQYLKDQHLEAIAKSIQSEVRASKQPINSRSKMISSMVKSPLPPDSQAIMSNLLKKITKKPLPNVPPNLQLLKTYKNFGQRPPKPEAAVTHIDSPTALELSNVMAAIDLKNISDSSIDFRQEPSSIIQPSNISFGLIMEEPDFLDEFDNDDDPGFLVYECNTDELANTCKEVAMKHGYPDRAIYKKSQDLRPFFEKIEEKKEADIKFPATQNTQYPVVCDNATYDCYDLKVIYDREKTGFEESKEFQIVINSVIAARYQVIEFLGSAAFSKAIQCLDLLTNEMVCLKIIENNKDYVDQSIDEIKLLLYVDCNADVDSKNLLKMYDFFYHKEHLFIVTELLKDNLYEYSKFNKEHEEKPYFTIGRLQKIAYQVLIGLEYLVSLKLIHCDLKPENILIKSFSNCEVKIIDLGSTCFIHDHLGSYVQSRSYRAPEVILGCQYDYRVDIWSLGCILGELFTGNVMFQNDSVQGLLARIIAICGPFPEEHMKNGRHVQKFFTKEKLIFQEVDLEADRDNKHLSEEMIELLKQKNKGKKKTSILVPKRSSVKARLHCEDLMFVDFVRCLLDVDKDKRPTAVEALKHPFITECKYQDGL